MKLILTALCATFMIIPAAFAGGDCDKCKKGEDKKEEGTVLASDCDKCKKGDEKKEEGTLLAHCGKCGSDKDHKKDGDKKDEKKEEGTVV